MTLPLPGRSVTRADRPRGRSSASSTGQAFMVGQVTGGPVSGTSYSLDEFVAFTGARISSGYLYDAAEAFFREGGTQLNWSLVVSSTAVTAYRDLLNGSAAACLRVSAGGPGLYGNSFRVKVDNNGSDSTIPVGYFVITVDDGAGTVIETMPPMADEASALAYCAANWKRAALSDQAGAGPPVSLAYSALANGTAGGAIVDADWQTALDRFTKAQGPGQVLAPGRTTSVGHLQVIAHAVANNRHALLDAPDTSVVATLTALCDADNAAPSNGGRRAQLCWPWAVVPGLTPYTTRTVPWSAVQAGLCARVDSYGNPNQPVAGEQLGKSPRWVLGLSQANPSDANRTTLNDYGVNVALMITDFGGGQRPVMYGNRTLSREMADPNWLQASGSRMMMRIEDEVDQVMRLLVHEQNQKGSLTGRLSGEIGALLGAHYGRGALYGSTPQDAYAVNCGPQINTDASIAAGLLKASVAVRVTPGADRVSTEIVRVSITDKVA